MLTAEKKSTIASSYLAGAPTPTTSAALIREIALRENLSSDSVRNLLVRANIYVPVPKGRSKVDDADRAKLIQEFEQFETREDFGEFHRARYDRIEQIGYKHGYSWYAVFRFLDDLGALPKHPREVELEADERNAEQAKLAQSVADKQARDAETLAFQAELERPFAKFNKQQNRLRWEVIVAGVFVLGAALLITKCVGQIDLNSGKSPLQRKCEQVFGTGECGRVQKLQGISLEGSVG